MVINTWYYYNRELLPCPGRFIATVNQLRWKSYTSLTTVITTLKMLLGRNATRPERSGIISLNKPYCNNYPKPYVISKSIWFVDWREKHFDWSSNAWLTNNALYQSRYWHKFIYPRRIWTHKLWYPKYRLKPLDTEAVNIEWPHLTRHTP